jgi:hypothetical protein
MAQQREIDAATGRCTVTGRAFEEGEEFYTVLFEDGDSFKRVDYCVDAWQSPPEGAYCHFKTRVPVKEKQKKLLVDQELLLGFFMRLAGETEPVRVQFRFVLALILMRKRLLRYEGSTTENGVEIWRMTRPRDQSVYQITNPCLTDDQIEGVSQQLSTILHSDMGKWAIADGESEPDGLETKEEGQLEE